MSLRIIYQRIPANQRICSYYRCRKPILRNIDRDQDGRLYHHGCLQSAKDERYRCLECYSIFDATQASFDEKQVSRDGGLKEMLQVLCPHCGSHNIKRL